MSTIDFINSLESDSHEILSMSKMRQAAMVSYLYGYENSQYLYRAIRYIFLTTSELQSSTRYKSRIPGGLLFTSLGLSYRDTKRLLHNVPFVIYIMEKGPKSTNNEVSTGWERVSWTRKREREKEREGERQEFHNLFRLRDVSYSRGSAAMEMSPRATWITLLHSLLFACIYYIHIRKYTRYVNARSKMVIQAYSKSRVHYKNFIKKIIHKLHETRWKLTCKWIPTVILKMTCFFLFFRFIFIYLFIPWKRFTVTHTRVLDTYTFFDVLYVWCLICESWETHDGIEA